MLPDQYKWLEGATEPAVIREALHLYGTLEGPGSQDNPLILGWAQEIGSKAGFQYGHDEIPWCGLFVAVCTKRAGLPLPNVAVRASVWDDWGVKADVARFGDVLRFQRPGGGHVGFYIGEDETCYHVLGGNQHDSVSISRIEKGRCVAIRRGWPDGQLKPVKLKAEGQVSEDEA
jgi:uncharacterized protein (TIGR02594 family)